MTLILSLALAAAATPALPRSLPLAYFEPNRGQAASEARFLARDSHYTLFLTARDAVFSLGGKDAAAVRLRFPGSTPASLEGVDRLAGVSHYFLGNDPRRWRTHVPHYARVRARGVYPGIDVVYYVRARKIEFDFEVAPQADPGVIEMAWDGARTIRASEDGGLIVATAAGDLVQYRPRVYQQAGGRRVEVAANYRVRDGRITVALARYDRTQPLLIDPAIGYSTFLGGSQFDRSGRVALDAAGNVYVCGQTLSPNFPTANAFDTTFGGNNAPDVFVAKFNFQGAAPALEYSTYLGGSGSDDGPTIAVDSNNNVYVAGRTSSGNFPLVNPLDATLSGGQDMFVTKLNPLGSAIVYSTYLGGGGTEGEETVNPVAVDRNGNIYVAGATNSADFPTTPGSYLQRPGGGSRDAFIAKIKADGSALLYGAVFGGGNSDRPIALKVDGPGNAYVAGSTESTDFPTTPNAYDTTANGGKDVFVTKLNAAGNAPVYSTYLGGNLDDECYSLALDVPGRVLVGGSTKSTAGLATAGVVRPNFGGGSEDGFLAKLNSAGTNAIFVTYLGGNDSEQIYDVAVSREGYVYATGSTGSANFHTTPGALDTTHNGSSDVFLTVLGPSGNHYKYSTFLGGGGDDIAVGMAEDGAGNILIAGMTASLDFPTTPGAFDTSHNGDYDVFLTRITGLPYPSCFGGLGPPSFSSAAAGAANVAVTVGAAANCNWFPIVSMNWVTATTTPPAPGPGNFQFSVAANPGAGPRTASVSAAGVTVPIMQGGTFILAPFDDVPDGHPYLNHVAMMRTAAITSGCTQTNYCPDSTTLRSQMAVFIVRAMLGGDTFPFPDTPYFADVPSTHPHFRWVQKFREFGITTGVTPTEYQPDGPVTRGQMAVFLIRSLFGEDFPFSTAPYFTDAPPNHPYFKYIQKMKEMGITTGISATGYGPDQPTTRGQMAVFIIRGFFTPR